MISKPVKYTVRCGACSHSAMLIRETKTKVLISKLRCTQCGKKKAFFENENFYEFDDIEVTGKTDFSPKGNKETQISDLFLEAALAKLKSEITQVEHRTDINDAKKIDLMVHYASATCAGVAIQPIPFADILILTPIQIYFGTRIAAICRIPVSESEISEKIKEIIGIIGAGILAQEIAIGIWKAVTFGAGGLLTIPLVYALSYAIMKVIAAYYTAKARGKKLSDEQIKAVYQSAFNEGREKNIDLRNKNE
jgi:uncharacterized protein (DUF697 family)